MKKLFSICLTFFIFFTLFPKPVFSADNFNTSYDVTYTVTNDGNTNANFNIAIKNKSAQFYASSYTIELGFSDIRNIKAYDPNGPILPVVTKTDEGNKIDVTFNKRVIGENNVLNFNLTFDTKDIAYKLGSIWEINIPGLSPKNDFSDFNVNVIVPQSFGDPTYIKPRQANNKLYFTKEQLGKSGISIAFGDFQVYDFNLTYYIGNTNIFPVKTEIAIPPSTNYQDVFIEDINPKPINVTEDTDGNWLAQYRLAPTQKMNITVKGKVKVSLYPKKQKITDREVALYLEERNYWQSSNPKIKQLAEKLKTPEAIYNYVINNLKYDFSRVTQNKSRLGALNTLSDPSSAVCLEFTDLFVALSRAAGIPAREIDGYANTVNSKQRPLSLLKDILHAWPEYYDKNLETWVMVDPTWGNTTGGVDYFNVLDFDHVAFIVKGQDSNYPVPAGGYKLPGRENTKDVNVDFSLIKPSHNQNFEISTDIPKSVPSNLPIKGEITIKNTSQELLDSQTVNVSSDFLSPGKQILSFSRIPPFGYETKKITFDKTSFLTNRKALVRITAQGREITASINISPLYLSSLVILGGILIGIFIIFIFVIAARTRRISFFGRKKESDLRGEGEKP
ncbi:MAG: transglutaminase-like domain-containing protein [Patescibacteria group bacterium]|nr:transglutaminase-like domain-containing protein [Patescibacteria group bacterium]